MCKAIYLLHTRHKPQRANVAGLAAIQGTARSQDQMLSQESVFDTCEILLSGECCTGNQV